MVKPEHRRLVSEYRALIKDPIDGIMAIPRNADLTSWLGIIKGPPNTPYDRGTFFVDIDYLLPYPLNPPLLRFRARVFHPNIHEDGAIALSILRQDWCPALTMSKILLSVQVFLADPSVNDFEDTLRPEVAALYLADREEYEQRVEAETEEHASWEIAEVEYQTVEVELNDAWRKSREQRNGLEKMFEMGSEWLAHRDGWYTQ